MIKLKEGDAYIVAHDTGDIGASGTGFFQRDTRWLSTLRWDMGNVVCLASQARRDELFQYFSRCDAHKVQLVGIERTLRVSNDGFDDVLALTNTSLSPQTVTVTLELTPDFRDVFTIWAQKDLDPNMPVVTQIGPHGRVFSRTASDGVASHVDVSFNPNCDDLSWTLNLEAGGTAHISMNGALRHEGLADAQNATQQTLPASEAFAARDSLTFSDPTWQLAYNQANTDLRTLLLPTEFGPYPAAGLPNFVNFFGRDALITSMMIGPQHRDISRAILTFLAHHQGTKIDTFREEEPGKIMHEIRRGELSRLGAIPFGRYYGSVDSTALYIMALGHYVSETGDQSLADELAPNWLAALQWLVACQAEDGLVRFSPSGSGLTVQSWKDSHDSMNHADGAPAKAPLAVAEVQGYAYAAFMYAGDLFDAINDQQNAELYRAKAARLSGSFHDLFWLEDLGTYAMALDKFGKPLAVKSSDAGHLLWCGIVPVNIAPTLVATLMGPECWSGWGLRTLGTAEVRYNPVSYHNGSVWPHDTALFGAGLARYDFRAELAIVIEGMFELAAHMPNHTLPELISGFPRALNRPPIAYTHACAPQAWAASGLLMLAQLQMRA